MTFASLMLLMSQWPEHFVFFYNSLFLFLCWLVYELDVVYLPINAPSTITILVL